MNNSVHVLKRISQAARHAALIRLRSLGFEDALAPADFAEAMSVIKEEIQANTDPASPTYLIHDVPQAATRAAAKIITTSTFTETGATALVLNI